jgi:hypothetical protein
MSVIIVTISLFSTPAFAIFGPPDPPGAAQSQPGPDVNVYSNDGSYVGNGVDDGKMNWGPPNPPGAAYDNRITRYRVYDRNGHFRGYGYR